MNFSEIVNEVRELRANKEWAAANFSGRTVAENTHPQAGFADFSESKVFLQGGFPCQDSWEDLTKEVLSWTSPFVQDLLRPKDVSDFLSGCGPDLSGTVYDRHLKNEKWNERP